MKYEHKYEDDGVGWLVDTGLENMDRLVNFQWQRP